MKQLLITIAAVVLVGTAFADPILIASRDGDLASVQAELDKGVDVNTKAITGVTSLHVAAGRGHTEIVELLITEGADVNAKGKAGTTPLELAIRNRRTKTANLLRKHGAKTRYWLRAGESIYIAANEGHIEAVKQHLAAGTDVNAKNRMEFTPLHYASIGGNKEVNKLLLDKGADVNAKDDRGWTPLFEAVNNGHKEIVELLIANGADVNAKHKTKYHFIKNRTKLYINNPTPLDWANISKQTEIADLLRKRGGNKSEVFEAEGK